MDLVTSFSLLTWSPLAVSILVALVFKQRQLVSRLRGMVARIIHHILTWLYPIKDTINSQHLPSAPFWGPEGSGDEAKFLNGSKNSLRWGILYGPIYRIWSGTHTEVAVTQAGHIKAIFHDSDRHLKAKNSDSGWMMGQVLGQCVGLVSGTEWASLRAHVDVPFTHKSVPEFLPDIVAGTQSYFSRLFEGRASNRGEAVVIHAAEDMKFLPFKLVATLIYGKAMSSELEKRLFGSVPTRPERWAELKSSETRYQMWRFGFGPRMCMGRHIAEKMLRVALVLLVRDREVRVEAKDEVEFETDPGSWITCPDVRMECHGRG
ncbi:hypothetical protein OQA88_4786 [Cercophora sp. LCS_1]